MRVRVARCWCEREALLRDMPSTRENVSFALYVELDFP